MGPPDEASDKDVARPELARPDNDRNRSEGDLGSDVRSIDGAIASVNELNSRIHMEVRKVLSSAMRDATNSGFFADAAPTRNSGKETDSCSNEMSGSNIFLQVR